MKAENNRQIVKTNPSDASNNLMTTKKKAERRNCGMMIVYFRIRRWQKKRDGLYSGTSKQHQGCCLLRTWLRLWVL